MPAPCEADWRHRVATSPFRAVVSFDGENLVLGSGTVISRLGPAASGTISLRPDAAHDRMVALLAVAGRGRVAKAPLAQLATALDDWRRGDRGLAAIRLAFAALPRLRDPDEAYSLFLAETALDAGLSPNDLLKALGYSACAPLLKFDPNQPRVPAGSGARSGQWTSSGAAAAATAPTRGPASSRPAPTPPKPAPDSAESIGPISVLFRPEPDGEDEVIQDKERRLGTGETEEDRIQEGRPFRFPIPGGIGPSTPGFPDFSAPAAPDTGAIPIPRLTPSPGGDAPPPPDSPPDDKEPDDKGLPCPPQQNDVPNGPKVSGDENEYAMSQLINPLNPTPKYSMATPDVVSQAYFLPSATPRGRTSFDDCKLDDTPTVLPIPDLKPGAMFEHKAPGWGWELFATNSQGYEQFETQVRNQNQAVAAEGLGRQIYYCLGNQTVADEARNRLGGSQSEQSLSCLSLRIASMKMFSVRAYWLSRAETPEQIASRLTSLLTILRQIAPQFGKWYQVISEHNVPEIDDSDERLNIAIAAKICKGDLGEPIPFLGYHCITMSSPTIDHSRTDQVYLSTTAGSTFQNELALHASHQLDWDPALVAYPVVRKTVLAFSKAFEPDWCEAGPFSLWRGMDLSVYKRGPVLTPCWMIYLSPPLAKRITPPPDVTRERFADGSLFMSVTNDTFDPDNSNHVDAAQRLFKVLDTLQEKWRR